MWENTGKFLVFLLVYLGLFLLADALTGSTSLWTCVFYGAFYLLGCVRGAVE